MAFTVNKKAFCVLEFAKTESIVTVQWRFQIMYHTEPPTDKTICEWYKTEKKKNPSITHQEEEEISANPKNTES